MDDGLGDPSEPPVVGLSPPLTDVAWSPDIVAQSLEALYVFLRDGEAWRLRPIHAETLRVGWSPEAEPGTVVVEAAARYELRPRVVHSTSWRYDQGRLILTYIAVVEPPVDLSPYLDAEPVVRSDLARGERLAPPTDIDVQQVVEHAFRHLAWLVSDDEVVRKALADWVGFLDAYEAEPFRAFGPPGG